MPRRCSCAGMPMVSGHAEAVHLVDFDEGGEMQFGGENLQVDHHGVGEDFGDEDGIGPAAGFVDLIGVDDEVFAENGRGLPF